MKLKLKATTIPHSTPISKKLASNFIELGYGLQVEGMTAEMFFNRSFEPFYPYREINKYWFDLYYDEKNPSLGFHKDWRVFDWYHSSYEHNTWFSFPGKAGHMNIDDDSTFLISTSPLSSVKLEYTDDAYHGNSAIKVINNGENAGGLAQDGKYCFAGVKYLYKGRIKSVFGEKSLSVALYEEGTLDNPVSVCSLMPISTEYTEVTAELSVPSNGRYTFVLILPGHTSVICDDFSMMPSDSIGKFKRSSVEAGKYVSPSVVRWPGGCFSSFYDWRDGVGNNRCPSYSYFWGGYQSNDIGTDELASYVEAIGAESMICINMYHPYKRYYDIAFKEITENDPSGVVNGLHGRDLPQFSNLEQGARDAADWVEYCNGDASTQGGRARIANGREKPYNVKYWEMDNEVHRWFRPEEYANACVLYSREMKKVDPEIKIGMASYCFGLDNLQRMLEIAGNDIDFLADRGFTEDVLQIKIDIIEKFNREHNRNIRLCNTEWLPLDGADVFNMIPRDEIRNNKCYMFSKWSYALDAAATMMMWQRHGEIIEFINFNNLANTHAQSVIETPKEGAFVTAAGMIMSKFAKTHAYQTLKLENYNPGRNDRIQVQISRNEKGDALVLNILNKSEYDEELSLDLTAFNLADGECCGVVLSAEGFTAMNRLDKQEITEKTAKISVKSRQINTLVPKLSFSEYIIYIKN